MKRVVMLVSCACVLASAAEEVWPGEGIRLVAGKVGTVAERGGAVYVTAGECPPTMWPTAYFVFEKPRDLSGCGAVKVTFTNCMDTAQRMYVKVKAVTEQGQLPDGGFLVPPRSTRTFRLALQLDNWVFDAPPGLLGLKRNPLVGRGSSYNLLDTRSIAVYMPRGTSNASFGVLKIELEPGDSAESRPDRRLRAPTFSPWVDEFGQAHYADWPDKVRSVDDLIAKSNAEEREIAAHPCGIPDADMYGGWAKGPKLKATGHFRTEKVDGKWWLVDPLGNLFFSHGVDHIGTFEWTPVSGREKYFEKLPPEDGPTKAFWGMMKRPALRYYYSDPANIPAKMFYFGRYNMVRKYGAGWREKSLTMIHKRMKSWGFNTVAASWPPIATVGESRLPYTVGIRASSRMIETVKAHWGALIDPFAPEFAENARKAAEGLRKHMDDPWCIGFFSGNEQSWDSTETGLASKILQAPDDQPAKVEFLRRLAEKGIDPKNVPAAELRAFGIAVAEKYYSTIRDAAKAVAPGLLYLGDRLAWGCPDVFRAASRYVDVVSINIYSHKPERDLPEGSDDKPILASEFHFGCYDTGYFYASLIPVKDQKARAAAYCGYVRTALDHPRYVGTHWYCWRDCPITGQTSEGANAQCGLVSTTDVPYAELIGAVRQIASEMYVRRLGK